MSEKLQTMEELVGGKGEVLKLLNKYPNALDWSVSKTMELTTILSSSCSLTKKERGKVVVRVPKILSIGKDRMERRIEWVERIVGKEGVRRVILQVRGGGKGEGGKGEYKQTQLH